MEMAGHGTLGRHATACLHEPLRKVGRMRQHRGEGAGAPTVYDRDFFESISAGSLASARTVLPMVVDLVGPPASVVDVGCGTGAWLRAFSEAGVDDYLGIDGDYVRVDQLDIPPDRFRAMDLTRPISLERRYDLVLCLEVGEHLPPSDADGLVRSLTALGDTVLFSAAIPYQGMRLYELRQVMERPPAGGRLRPAEAGDRSTAVDWVQQVSTEIGEPSSSPENLVDEWLQAPHESLPDPPSPARCRGSTAMKQTSGRTSAQASHCCTNCIQLADHKYAMAGISGHGIGDEGGATAKWQTKQPTFYYAHRIWCC